MENASRVHDNAPVDWNPRRGPVKINGRRTEFSRGQWRWRVSLACGHVTWVSQERQHGKLRSWTTHWRCPQRCLR